MVKGNQNGKVIFQLILDTVDSRNEELEYLTERTGIAMVAVNDVGVGHGTWKCQMEDNKRGEEGMKENWD